MARPLISGAIEPPSQFEEQPIPVAELSLIFGVVLLLTVGYLYYTARIAEPQEAQEAQSGQ